MGAFPFFHVHFARTFPYLSLDRMTNLDYPVTSPVLIGFQRIRPSYYCVQTEIKFYFWKRVEDKGRDGMARKFDSFRVPDAKYIKKGYVSRSYVLTEDADRYVKAMTQAFKGTDGENLSHIIREWKRIMGDPPDPLQPPKVPAGKSFKWPSPKARKRGKPE